MKTITIIAFLLSVFYHSNDKKDFISSNYDCSTSYDEIGRCTGSAYCTACKNCSRCAHCSNGGTCGVCSGTSNNFYSSEKKKSRKTTSTNYSNKLYTTKKYYYADEEITIYNDSINLREKPSTSSKILEKLSFGDKVIFIEKTGDWIKVKVEENENIGYLYSKILK
ncbi:SH3 domain-containing protein [Flavobacterium sp.]|mgnify:CR=1 FL=1|uniref:SH3 domain-containing protein n=1 Tax=Flavobacterium sp. TaxID=239 RepID=UPI002FDDCDD2